MIKRYHTFLPNLKESWLLVLLLVVGGGIGGSIVAVVATLIFPELISWNTVIAYPLMFIPPFFYIALRVYNTRGTLSVPFHNPDYGKVGAPLFFILLLILVISAGVAIDPLTDILEMPDYMKKFLDTLSDNKLTGFITLAVFAPILEEFFCRGIILRGLLSVMKPWKAILWSALIFGVIHLNPWQAIPAFLIGLLLGWIYYKSRSLWAVIFMHFVNNGTAFLMLVFFPALPQDFSLRDIFTGNSYYYLYFLALILLTLIIYVIKKGHDKALPDQIRPNYQRESLGRDQTGN